MQLKALVIFILCTIFTNFGEKKTTTWDVIQVIISEKNIIFYLHNIHEL